MCHGVLRVSLWRKAASIPRTRLGFDRIPASSSGLMLRLARRHRLGRAERPVSRRPRCRPSTRRRRAPRHDGGGSSSRADELDRLVAHVVDLGVGFRRRGARHERGRRLEQRSVLGSEPVDRSAAAAGRARARRRRSRRRSRSRRRGRRGRCAASRARRPTSVAHSAGGHRRERTAHAPDRARRRRDGRGGFAPPSSTSRLRSCTSVMRCAPRAPRP